MTALTLAQGLNMLGLIAATLACVSYTIRWATSRNRGYLVQGMVCFGFVLFFLPNAVPGSGSVGPFTIVGGLFVVMASILGLRLKRRERVQ